MKNSKLHSEARETNLNGMTNSEIEKVKPYNSST